MQVQVQLGDVRGGMWMRSVREGPELSPGRWERRARAKGAEGEERGEGFGSWELGVVPRARITFVTRRVGTDALQ